LARESDVRRYSILLSLIASALQFAVSSSADAAETCWAMGAGQFAEGIAFCTSAVLHPIGEITYGPERLADSNPMTAWCVPAPAADDVWIELRIDRGSAFRRLLLQNGYGKSPEVYRNNSRPKTIEISTDNGKSGSAVLPDHHELVAIQLPSVGEYRVVRIKIVDVYPGEKYGDICLDYLMPDFEYEETLRQASSTSGRPKPADPFGQLELPSDKSLELKLK
jgi:hypothetical protein